MTFQRIFSFVVLAAVLVFGVSPAMAESSVFSSDNDPQALLPSENPLTENRSYKGGKTMEQIVKEAKKGFPTSFTKDEMHDVMEASRALRETNRSLSDRLERIGSKMARYYKEE